MLRARENRGGPTTCEAGRDVAPMWPRGPLGYHVSSWQAKYLHQWAVMGVSEGELASGNRPGVSLPSGTTMAPAELADGPGSRGEAGSRPG
jgi:hypothetical protein